MLFGHILDAAIGFTQAEGATIYMVDDETQVLRFIKIFNSKMNVSLNLDEITWPPISLYKEDKQPNLSNLAALCYHEKKSFNFPDVYEQDVFDYSGTVTYDKRNKYRTQSIVAIPMMDHKGNIIGIIQLINSLNAVGKVIPFSDIDIKNLEVLTSISAILMNNHKLISDLQTTFNQFIQSIAWAIDRKSKHFSGHIARVSTLVNMFAGEINAWHDESLKYSSINFSKDELEELNIAGLMHDLGKIITPMHILDKSSKLEAIFNRLELVKERMAHIRSLIGFDISKADKEGQEKLNCTLETLSEYEAFLEKINPGRENFTEKDREILRKIYEFRYSYQDKNYFILTENENYNLSIRSGTLNREDIVKIREHAYVTGKMLSQIKFPKYLARAPLYAESHHEKLNGKGYPRGLSAAQIPLQSRILALADVFEALTAVRPYKESKTLSETYTILKKMVDANEIDGDLLEFAIKSGLFMKYACSYLEPEQIDIE
ncbi:MAG: metal-dependent phosphohydrolase [Candidatus Cloacimonetes bacterium]|nr:metal-dependent phosphohydrolase [Candidatus Cloacimonadota bacterium]